MLKLTTSLVLGLALAMSAATVATCLLLRDAVAGEALAVEEAGRITYFFGRPRKDPTPGIRRVSFSVLAYLKERSSLFDGIGFIDDQGPGLDQTLRLPDGSERYVRVMRLSEQTLRLLGARFILGGEPSSEGPGGLEGLVLSEGLWRHEYGADPQIVGQPITFGTSRRLISGVVADESALTVELAGRRQRPDIYALIPRNMPNMTGFLALVRIPRGTSRESLEVVLAADSPFSERLRPALEPITADPAITSLEGHLAFAVWAAGFLALVAVTLAASSALLQVARKQSDLGVRVALGGGSRTIAWHSTAALLTRPMIVMVLALTVLALVVRPLSPQTLPATFQMQLQPTIAHFVWAGLATGTLTVLTVFAVYWLATTRLTREPFRRSHTSHVGGRSIPTLTIQVALITCMSLGLTVLAVRIVAFTRSIDNTLDPAGTYYGRFVSRGSDQSDNDFLGLLESSDGISHASLATGAPFSIGFRVFPDEPSLPFSSACRIYATPNYFGAIGLLTDVPPVGPGDVLVSSFAMRDGASKATAATWHENDETYVVRGIAPAIPNSGNDLLHPCSYFISEQIPSKAVLLIIRTRQDERSLELSIERALAATSTPGAVQSIASLDSLIRRQTAIEHWLLAGLLVALGVLSVGLAMSSALGLLQRLMTLRRRIAVLMSLGAGLKHVRRTVLYTTIREATIGLTVGAALGLWGVRALGSSGANPAEGVGAGLLLASALVLVSVCGCEILLRRFWRLLGHDSLSTVLAQED